MKRRNIQLFLLLGVLAMTSLFSCGVDRWPEYYPLTGRDLWIDSIMREEYLWFEDIPNSKDLNYFLSPEAFLEKIKSPLDKGYSSVDTLYGTPPPSYGFDYNLYRVADNDTAYLALVTYVIPESPASEIGLKRGEWIMQINDDFITKKTEKLLTEGENQKLSIGRYVTKKNEEGEEEGSIESYREANLPASRPVEDVVIPAYALYTSGTLNIGYLAYNHFSKEYNSELLRLSQLYKEKGVTDFILDLRYNDGGEMECVQLLADILVPADKLGSPFASLVYSQKRQYKNHELTLDAQLPEGGSNLNLPKVYVLTSSTTAAASEMLINCLKPYMKVVVVGSTTKGVTVATESFPSNQFLWVLRPVVCEVFNSEDEADYAKGFTPDYAVSQLSNFAKVLPLGDPDEELISAALGIINGSIVLPEPEPTPETQMTVVKSVKVKRTFRNGLIIK
ncbi:S41 family peptidase [Bacteroides stercorirosoris]|uniref:S41 family peptidase n=1 Tax=Bacteroides stercorirosoris TaxID=871324 RepID=UPI0023F6E178|nr:S41 family peptidase [Bacteroides stercorirosoris]